MKYRRIYDYSGSKAKFDEYEMLSVYILDRSDGGQLESLYQEINSLKYIIVGILETLSDENKAIIAHKLNFEVIHEPE